MCVDLMPAPASWGQYFPGTDGRVVPLWMTEQAIQDRRRVAREMQQLLGKAFEVSYSPNSTVDFGLSPDDSIGHVIVVNYRRAMDLGFVAFDLRENFRQQIAEWFGTIAGELCTAAGQVNAETAQQPAAASESIVTLFEVVDLSTGGILHRSLQRAECLRFQAKSSARSYVRGRDALLCSPQTAGGAA